MSNKDSDKNHLMDSDLAVNVLEQIPTPVMAVDRDLKVIFMNAAGRRFLGKSWEEINGYACHELFNSQHCLTSDCRMQKVIEEDTMHTARNEVTVDGRTVPIEYTAASLKNKDGDIVGGLEYIIDISERVLHEQKMKEQSKTIMEISTPAISLWDRIVVLPVVGVVDSFRAQHMMDSILTKITETLSKVIILDIQGVAAVDTAVANHLIKITKATKLMGCRCIISGVSSPVAQTLVQLGIDLGDVATNSTLKDALGDAFALLDFEVKKVKR